MFHPIASHVPADPDLPPRARTLTLLRRVLDGTFYDALPYEFHEERTSAGEYIPLRLRRPSVRYALPRIVVENSVALLFSNAHFPTLQSTDASVRDALAALLRNLNATQLMTEAAVAGSIGTACIQLRILRGRPFAGLLDPAFLTPVWDPEAPDTLLSVIERYKVSGAALIAAGHAVRDPRAGAVATFIGYVREQDHGRAVSALDYSSHDTAAEVLQALAERLAERPGVVRLGAVHRVGHCEIGDIAVIAAVAAVHRAEAFEVCRELIDTLKRTVPIWKHQVFTDGSDEWVGMP